MRFHRNVFVLALAVTGLLTSANARAADLPKQQPPAMTSAGVVALIEGTAYALQGEVHDAVTATADDRPGFVKFAQNTKRRLKPNDRIEEGEIIQTMGDSYLKVLFKDDSMLDIGPTALVQVQKFAGDGPGRTVLFKVLYGRLRGVVAQPLAAPDHYQIVTPSLLLGVRGTEYIVNVTAETDRKVQTEIVCIHGQVSVDVAKHTDQGVVYTQPIVVNPSSSFVASGVHGLGQQTKLQGLKADELRAAVARVSPLVNVRATAIALNTPPYRLPGTGVRMVANGEQQQAPRRASEKKINSFDLDHPPAARGLASASGNFEVPHDFKTDPAAFGQLRDFRRMTGPAPLSLLPATMSRVRVTFTGAQ